MVSSRASAVSVRDLRPRRQDRCFVWPNVWCIGAVDGAIDQPAWEPTRGVLWVVGAASGVTVDECLLSLRATIRAPVGVASGPLPMCSSPPNDVVLAGAHNIGHAHSPVELGVSGGPAPGARASDHVVSDAGCRANPSAATLLWELGLRVVWMSPPCFARPSPVYV
jgi:hypothetical protein